MALTLKWWTDLKKEDAYKVNGTVAPESDFEKKLKAYEDLRTKAIGPPSLKSAVQGLAAVEAARAGSANLLKATFPKLAAECDPHTGQTLTTHMTEEKTFLEEKTKEINAKNALGGAQMQGLGPGANMRQKAFTTLQGNIKTLHDGLKKTPKLEKKNIDGYAEHMKKLEKDVTLYCKDHPTTKQFHDDYVKTITDFKTVKDKFGTPKMVEAMKSIGTQLGRMVDAEYVK